VIQLRIVAPSTLAGRVVEVLERAPSAYNVVHLEGAASKPRGDLILADAPREDASVILDELRALGVEAEGSVSVLNLEATVSERGRRAEELAAGSSADAVIWEEVEARTSESTELSVSFLSFMVLATLIAAVGILTDSIILIIGAMVVGPEFGPLAGFCTAIVTRRLALARRSFVALAVGFPLAIAASALLTLILRGADQAPDSITHPETIFISDPNVYSVIVAALAGVAGLLSLTTAKSSALLGVLISVTTIPAAANVGVAAAYADWNEFGGALLQLVINLFTIMVAGTATLAVQRALFERRRTRFHKQLEAAESASHFRRGDAADPRRR
jgi:uncharacterized hydrophobic protein (TIGR00271 family)